MTVKSVLLIALIGTLAPLAIASPCKPSTTTSITSAEVTTSALDTTYTQATSTTAEAATTTEAVTTTEATTTTEAAPASTTITATNPSCGIEGSALISPYKASPISRDSCRQICLGDVSCKTFLISEGFCWRYGLAAAELVIPGSTGAFFYDRNCPPMDEDPQ